MRFRRYSGNGFRCCWIIGQEETKERCRFVEAFAQSLTDAEMELSEGVGVNSSRNSDP